MMSAKQRRFPQAIELLEPRVFLSAYTGGLTPAELALLYGAGIRELQHPTTTSTSGVKGPLSKLNGELLTLYKESAAGQTINANDLSAIQTRNFEPAVTLDTRGNSPQFRRKLAKLGFSLIDVSGKGKAIQGYISISSLMALSKLGNVKAIIPIGKAVLRGRSSVSTRSVGAAVNQADSAMQIALARTQYSVDGTGIKIGVISDSVNQVNGGIQDSITSGDLPPNVQVLQDGQPGDTDEGRAMLEEIHDTAPGASLAFYSGDGGQQSMANAIRALQGVGCRVIVDDLGYSDEPFFQDGVISKAIDSFSAAGGTYVSAIGNDGSSGYQRNNVQYFQQGGSTWVNFAPTGTPNKDLNINVSGDVSVQLEWDNPYNGIVGSASSEIDLYFYDKQGNLITSSTNQTLVSGVPEQTTFLSAGSYTMEMRLNSLGVGASPPDMYKIVFTSDGLGALTSTSYPGIMSSANGHAVGTNTISVGAVPFSSAPPFSSVTPIKNETFSATGPVTTVFDSNGVRYPAPLTLQKPDVSGIDGINTSFFGDNTPTDPTTRPQFFGTSAAAPNVAAVVALMDQFHPGSSSGVIDQALRASGTALDGAAPGAWDPQGGYGLVNAVKAIAYFGAPTAAPTAVFAPVATQIGGLSSETITFSEPVIGVSLGAFTLTLSGSTTNLLNGLQSLTTTDNQTFTIGNLASVTTASGTYTLTLVAAGSGITGNGIGLAANVSVSWQTTGG